MKVSMVFVLLYCCRNYAALVISNKWIAELANEDKSDVLISQKVCDIARKYPSKLNFIYKQQNSLYVTSLLELRLYKCMASERPIYMLEMDKFIQEPLHNATSINIFTMPTTKTAALASVKAIERFLNKRQKMKHLHKYIFVWRGALQSEMKQLFELIWSKHILNAIVLTDSKRLYTFEPFSVEGFRVKLIPHERYFYDKLRNLHRFQLNISMFSDLLRAQPKINASRNGYNAIDGLVASTIVQQLNATALYILPADNQSYGYCRKGNFTGAIGDIITGAAHVGFNSRFTLDCMKAHIEELYPYYRRLLFLVVPAAEMQPGYKIFFQAFTNSLWALLLLNATLVYIVYYMLQRTVRHIPRYLKLEKKFSNRFDIFEILFKTQLGMPLEPFVRISSLRLFLISWIMFSYIVTSIYFARLESGFVQPSYEAPLNALDNLHKLTVPIYAFTNLLEAIKASLLPRHAAEINARVVILQLNYTPYKYAFKIAQQSPNVAFVLRDDMAKEFLANTYNLEENRPSFHVVKEYLGSMPRSYSLTLGSPFRYKFDEIVNAFFEFGFLEHWLAHDVRHRSGISYKVEEFYDKFEIGPQDESFSSYDENRVFGRNRQRVVLNLDILQGAFYIWLIGIFLSVLGFCIEYVYWLYTARCSV